MKKTHLYSLLLSIAMSLFLLVLFLMGTFQTMENRSLDFRFRVRGDRPAHPAVAIVTIDEKSIKEMGHFPWPRDMHARLVDRLARAGAKAVAFDVLFTEPHRDHPKGDVLLGQAAAKHGRVTFGMLFQQEEGGAPANPLLTMPALRHKRIHAGFVNIFPETDGVTRKVPLWISYQNQLYPSLSLSALAAAEGKSAEEVLRELKPSVEGTWNEMNVNFVGGYESFPYFSYSDVLRGRIPADRFKDKIVLVGGTATGLFDFKAVPNVPVFPGLEIHANALDNYYNRSFLRRVDWTWAALLILLFGLGCGLMAARLPAWAGALTAAAWIGTYFFICQTLFTDNFILLDFVAPTAAVVGNYVAVLFYRFLTEEREKRWIKGTFSQYMSPKIVEVLTADPSKLKLGGEERELTVFFSDLVGFTSLSEAMKPQDLVKVLNEYFTDMTNIILRHEGVLDKYIGDAIMSFWNAPVDQPRHATLACFAALDQLEQLAILQKSFAERGIPSIDCRIGINTGPAVVGNMGSNTRFDYTVMGDPVNLASRLEGANKPYHTRIMISEFTYEKAKDDVEVRPLDLLRVKGKAVPIKVYELIARKGQLSEDQKKAFALYNEALAFYLDRKFDKAIDKLTKVRGILPDDGPSQVYIDRSKAYIAAPPPKEWDGVYVMTTK